MPISEARCRSRDLSHMIAGEERAVSLKAEEGGTEEGSFRQVLLFSFLYYLFSANYSLSIQGRLSEFSEEVLRFNVNRDASNGTGPRPAGLAVNAATTAYDADGGGRAAGGVCVFTRRPAAVHTVSMPYDGSKGISLLPCVFTVLHPLTLDLFFTISWVRSSSHLLHPTMFRCILCRINPFITVAPSCVK